jgi:16S rRNA (guanine527-N7)-methyltransferase
MTISDTPSGSAYVDRMLRAAGIHANEHQRALWDALVATLLEWNARVNLISRKDVDQVWRNHILHSLAVLAIAPLPAHGRILDLGTGGGLPGVPLAIMLPEARFVLCDSIGKKVNAVRAMTEALALPNTECVTARAEELADSAAYRASFDVVLARAVTRLPILAQWARPLLKREPGALLIAWKGGDLTDELEQTRRVPGVRSVATRGFERLPEPYFETQEKHLIIVEFGNA